ncbi:hypothetical protein LguiB_024524 [Lonicera macranthoides]
MDGGTIEPVQEATHVLSSPAQPEETERKARVDAVWQQMNKGVSTKKLNTILNKPSSSSVNRTLQKTSSQIPSASWMTVLGLAPRKTPSSHGQGMPERQPSITQNCRNNEAKRIAASALSAVKDAAILAAASGRGKIEVTEVRDFAGEEVEVKKLVDANSKEASEKGKAVAAAGAPSAVDAVLEQIRKKPKLSVLDKTKKDWGEFKEENKLDEELDAYKKSGNQYLEKVSFLQRADYREFERERDVRLALQAKRKPDV